MKATLIKPWTDKAQPEVIQEVDETLEDDPPIAGQFADDQPAEISDNQDKQKAFDEIEGTVLSLFSLR